MRENFHKILDDPLLQVGIIHWHTVSRPCWCMCDKPCDVTFFLTVQALTRQSLLRMLRAQSAMVNVYKEHVTCLQTWGRARWVLLPCLGST